MTMVRILLVAVLVVLGMVVVMLGVVPDLQVAEEALVAVAVAVVLVAVVLVQVLAEVPEEVQEVEALVHQAVQAQAVQDQVNLPPVRVKEEDLFHLQGAEVRLKEEVQTQEQSVDRKTLPQPRVVSRRVAVMAALAVAAKEVVARNKKAGKKK